MKEQLNEILSKFDDLDEESKKEVIIECSKKIGSTEWEEAVKELWDRIKKIRPD